MLKVLKNRETLKAHISRVLYERTKEARLYPPDIATSLMTSSVLFLMGEQCDDGRSSGDPCLVFNKRSARVRQAGDLCFPGGRINPHLDVFLSRFLKWPLSPLVRWPYWPQWRNVRKEEARRLSIVLATSLRESVEEMRLNPLGLTFLGPMPPSALSMFQRVLYPMVVWINRQKHFFPNWEVEKIVRIPLKNLLVPDAYACYRIRFVHREKGTYVQDFPCFNHERDKEILWGVTYRIVMAFLEFVFQFTPPALESLRVVRGVMKKTYLNGAG
jgi:8-oxo-dGTP pyrophosphatase MutT (NUDIX family)